MSLSEDIVDFSPAPMRGDIEVNADTANDYTVGMNDEGEAIYLFNGWEMTKAQHDSLVYSDNDEYNPYDNEINTYDLTEKPVAFNDFGEPVYSFNGLQMTVAQHKALFGESDETCTPEQRDNFDKFLGVKPEDVEKNRMQAAEPTPEQNIIQEEEDEPTPKQDIIQEEAEAEAEAEAEEPTPDQEEHDHTEEEFENIGNCFNKIKDEYGDVGEFFSDALLSDDSEELDTMSMNTGLTHEEITNTAHAVLSDISKDLGHDYENMRAWLEYDIAQVRASGSEADRVIIDAAIKKAFKADYKGAMHLWDSYHKINNIN
ncbi:hypothetical protein [Aeromonas veronii]|uniref:hypothetical protein n=1 Tax=Aeromonas veronii TaxID=654 RepID=UPI000B59AAEB|nr:hypothetical protein [Aeromonas veronii]